ncbi:MAG TPA: SDR family oxidoreductase [Hyphomicrobiaceae bacterium]|nr:SDR family oxidoreductase [Hyphomicrobiaceae bacterium]
MNFFITGGSRGIGSSLVRDLVAAGHNVAFTYYSNETSASKLTEDIATDYPDRLCKAYHLDVRDSAWVERVGEQVEEDLETVDAVILNAATNRSGLAVSTSDDDWREIIDVNLSGVFYVCRCFLPIFLSQRNGRFIHISSVARHGMSGLSAYAASKAGLCGLSASLAKEYGRKGITSNVLTLGFFDTDMTRNQMPGSHKEFWNEFCPIGRIGVPSDISGAVLYLASEQASFVNGETISLTGGLNWGP